MHKSLYVYNQILMEDRKPHLLGQESLKIIKIKSQACKTGNIAIMDVEILRC